MKEITQEVIDRAKRVKLVVFDVDGVLTDGTIYMGPEGEALKAFSARDGMGITLLHRAGLKTAIITGRTSRIVENRGAELRITKIYQGCHDKNIPWQELLTELGLEAEEVAYVGDDLNDLPLLARAGFPCSVADGSLEAKEMAVFVSKEKGGKGAVREIAEFILHSQGLLEGLKASFLAGGIKKIAQ